MKTDDPRLQKALKEYKERAKKMDALTLAVIKGHLLVEQAMDELIAASVFHPEFLRESRLQFRHKICLCQSMGLNEQNEKMWPLLMQANVLRNAIAHGKSADNIKSAAGSVRSMYASVLGAQAKDLNTQLDDQVVADALFHCSGFLTAVAEDAKARRKIIDEHWNPS
jgi:hypothetical protein